MPSGRRVTAQANCRIFNTNRCLLSISICVHADDADNSEGLCGDYNGARVDELIPDGWTTPDTNYLEPVLFTSSYMYVGSVVVILFAKC